MHAVNSPGHVSWPCFPSRTPFFRDANPSALLLPFPCLTCQTTFVASIDPTTITITITITTTLRLSEALPLRVTSSFVVPCYSASSGASADKDHCSRLRFPTEAHLRSYPRVSIATASAHLSSLGLCLGTKLARFYARIPSNISHLSFVPAKSTVSQQLRRPMRMPLH